MILKTKKGYCYSGSKVIPVAKISNFNEKQSKYSCRVNNNPNSESEGSGEIFEEDSQNN